MRTRTLLTVALGFAVPITAAIGTFFGSLHFKERQRVNEADAAFRPILHLGANIFSQPVAFHRYCRYVVEFPPDSQLSDLNVSELRSLNRLSQQNTLDVTIYSRKLTDESLPHLKNIDTFDLLDVTGTSISDSGIEELREALPDTVVPGRGGVKY